MAELDRVLLARIDELLRRADRGEITYTPFLTPGEQMELSRLYAGARDSFRMWGGYAEAERKRMFCLPPYLGEADEPLIAECLADTYAECLLPLLVQGSGYRTLSHRDYLGALLHLGVERDRIGDICVTSPHSAILFCDRIMADFFAESLTRVANDAVRVSVTAVPEDFDGGRSFLPISDTVASPRADAVVAALANLPRERAQALFREGRVEIDYTPEERVDRPVAEGAVIVIRGCGKFIIRSLSDKTKKGRFRLLADKYN